MTRDQISKAKDLLIRRDILCEAYSRARKECFNVGFYNSEADGISSCYTFRIFDILDRHKAFILEDIKTEIREIDKKLEEL